MVWEESRAESRIETQVREMGARVAQCLLRGDSKALADLLGEGFILRLPSGDRVSREVLLELLSSGEMRYEALSVEFNAVQVYDGNVAFVSGASHSAAFYRGRHHAGRFPFTALYVCRKADWQIVAIHHMDVGASNVASASSGR